MISRVVLRAVGVVLSLCALTWGAAARAQKPPLSPKQQAFEASVAAELSRGSEGAAAAFAEGTAARDRDDYEAARRAFQRAHELSPRSSHPLRRLCYAELRLKLREEALGHCRDAVTLDPSAPNLATLATVLISSDSMTDQNEGFEVAQRAVVLDPDDELVDATYADAALVTQHDGAFQDAVDKLRRAAPDSPTTAYLSAIDKAMKGEWSDADNELDRAKALGMPAEEVESLRGRMRDGQPLYLRAWHLIRTIGIAWLAVLAFLTLGGLSLSRAALRAANDLPADNTGHARGADALLRRAYGVLLWLACAFYYASIPLVLGLVVLLGGGLLYGFLALGRVPVKLAVIVLIAVLTTVWAVLKSLFARPRDTPPGTEFDLTHHPRFAGVLKEVARKVGTRAVDCVYLTPGTDIAVFERGNLWGRLRGERSERCLVLGVGVLQRMQLVDFKAVLAHEHGHFKNEDTAGGGFALAVRRSILLTALGLAQGGVATWYNPAWWFVRGFFLLFLRISQGASRLQEILADRWAAFSYGAEAFERGLRHAVARGAVFETEANAKLDEIIRAKRPLSNLYSYETESPPDARELNEAVRSAIERKPSPYDSHPAPLDRIALVRRLRGTPAPPEDPSEALDLFEDREQIEQLMTDEVRGMAAKSGVRIPKAA